MRFTKRFSACTLALALAALPFELGCSAGQAAAVAQNTATVISNVIKIAQGDITPLEQTGVISAAEGTAVETFLTGLSSISSQLSTCVAGAVSAGSKKAAFLSCFTTFASGITPGELALFRVINPKAQAKVVEWVAVITIGVNTVIALTGGSPVVPAGAPAAAAPATSQLLPLAVQAGITEQEFRQALRITSAR